MYKKLFCLVALLSIGNVAIANDNIPANKKNCATVEEDLRKVKGRLKELEKRPLQTKSSKQFKNSQKKIKNAGAKLKSASVKQRNGGQMRQYNKRILLLEELQEKCLVRKSKKY